MKRIAWGFSLFGMTLLVIGVWLLVTAYASTNWPSVQGTVAEAKVTGRISQVSDPLRRHVEYIVEAKYYYLFEKEFYYSTRYSLGTGSTIADGFNSKSEAREWLKQSPYQKGANVTVHVDPKNPASAVLSSGIQWSTFVPLILGLLTLGFGGLCFWLSNQVTQNHQQKSNPRPG